MEWHNGMRNSNYVFNFQEEIVAYCRSDVDILRRCCLEFRELFHDVTEIDPFANLTIASACSTVYRTNYLEKDIIAIIPPHGYRPENKQSLFAQKWLSYIASFDWSAIFNMHDCDIKYEKFNDTMSAMIDKFFPLERTSVRKCDKPWMTSSIKSAIARRQKALHESGKNSDIYKYWRYKVQSSIKAARKKCYVGSVGKLKNSNPARWWKEVKALGGLSSKSSWYSQLLSDDVRNCEDLAETFNSFLVALTSHFDPLPQDDNMASLEVPSEYLVNTQQVYKKLHEIKTIKSPGPDMLPNKILKIFASELAPIIADIYNSFMMQGIFPKALKRSIVVPVPKVSPSTSIEDDLRPISLTSQIAKVVEDCTLDILFPQVINKLDTKQFALPKKSTTHALVYLLPYLFADFKKGFDLVDHNEIVKELVCLGVQPVVIRWI